MPHSRARVVFGSAVVVLALLAFVARGASQAVVAGRSSSSLDLRERLVSDGCVFCGIVRRTQPASIVWEDDLTMAFVDLRQFHAGHTLVIPRQHICDVRELDQTPVAALMSSLIRITRAATTAFPNQGLSLWHSIGEAADQE